MRSHVAVGEMDNVSLFQRYGGGPQNAAAPAFLHEHDRAQIGALPRLLESYSGVCLKILAVAVADDIHVPHDSGMCEAAT